MYLKLKEQPWFAYIKIVKRPNQAFAADRKKPRPLKSNVSGENDNMKLLEEALKCPKCIVSVMGDHAGEGVVEIFNRKKSDIERLGITFWLMRSPKARPPQVQELTKSIVPTYTIFVAPATKGGARPTTQENAASEFSGDGKIWQSFPDGLSPVTGKHDNSATALVFDMMATDVRGVLDLWDYADEKDINDPLKFILHDFRPFRLIVDFS